MFSNNYWQKVSEVEAEGDRTAFTWTVGRVKKCSFGDSIKSSEIKAGGKSWKVVYFPKGFTDPDYASAYITNIDCELDEGDAENPDKITSCAFATITVTMTPKPPDFDGGEQEEEPEEEEEDDEDDDGEVSVPSSKAPPSTKQDEPAGSKKGKSKKGSKAGSVRSAGSRATNASQLAAEGPGGPVEVVPIRKELSQMYTNKESSWGFEKLFDIGKLYKAQEGYMTNFGKNKEDIQLGQIEMRIEIFCASGIRLDDPELDEEITEQGRQRISWNVHNIKRVTDAIGPNKKLSSSDFESDGHWYLDIYPSGFKTEQTESTLTKKPSNWISLYLHSTRRQVELGEVYKVWFKFGVKKINPTDEELKTPNFDTVYFPPQSSCVSVFTPRNKCFGKQCFMKVSDLAEGVNPNNPKEFLIGSFETGGSVIFVLDMLVTDDEVWGVQHMLHEIPVFGHTQDKCCETEEPFNEFIGKGKVICYHCGKAFSKDETRYQARMEEYGYEVGREYITDILMREEEHWLDGFMKKINIADKIDQGVKYLTKRVAKMRIENEPDASAGVDIDSDEEEQDDDKLKPKELAQLNAKREKERKEQLAYVNTLKSLQREVEDSHFSKPICSKCAEKRKMLQACRVIYANEATKRLPSELCPDQNACTTPQFAKKKERNFRKGWKEILTVHEQKVKEMEEAMAPVTVKSPKCAHAADPWIQKRLSAADKAMNPLDKPGRNAMTHVRGNRLVEPLELTRQCNGRVNPDGITPQEDEDAPRDTFCDVRFDVRNPPPAIYCLYSGKVYCEYCAGKECKFMLPMFEKDPSEAQLVQVCQDSKEKLGKLPAPRIQAESKKEVEEVVHKRRGGGEEEEEDEPDEPPFITMFRSVPLCGNQLADKVNETLFPEEG